VAYYDDLELENCEVVNVEEKELYYKGEQQWVIQEF
jgi:hypothetical protein